MKCCRTIPLPGDCAVRRCVNEATVVRLGRPYCHVHDPVNYQKAKYIVGRNPPKP
jgi:hypothetical protein